MKTKIVAVMMLSASCLFTNVPTHAQNWVITGNANATAASKLGTTNNIPLRLFTNNTEQLHINANVAGKVGFVGLGTAAPATRLHVNGVITVTGGTSTNWNTVFTRVPAGATNKVPRWNGTSYIAGSMSDNGSLVGVGGAVLAGYRLNVNATTSLGGINVADPGDNYILNCAKSGFNSGIYITKNNVSSGTACITGTNFGAGGGIEGLANTGNGVYASSSTGIGLYAYSSSGNGIYAYSSATYGAQIISGSYRGLYVSSDPAYFTAYFEGNVYATGTFTSSDAKLKKNITSVDNAMGIINRLQPKHYEFRHDGNYAKLNLPQGTHYGLLAQDLEKVLPGLVKDAGTTVSDLKPKTGPSVEGQPAEKVTEEKIDFKAVNYTELIPIMIKAMQEQQQQIEGQAQQLQAQQQHITDLAAENQQMKQDMQHCCLNHGNANGPDKLQQPGADKAALEQNAPNPFTEQTLIRYYLPAGSQGQLKVMSLDGKEQLTSTLTRTGYGELTISANTLAAGTYTYTLIVNGKAVESRIMILSE